MFLEHHEDIVMHKLSGGLVCTEKYEAKLTVL